MNGLGRLIRHSRTWGKGILEKTVYQVKGPFERRSSWTRRMISESWFTKLRARGVFQVPGFCDCRQGGSVNGCREVRRKAKGLERTVETQEGADEFLI